MANKKFIGRVIYPNADKPFIGKVKKLKKDVKVKKLDHDKNKVWTFMLGKSGNKKMVPLKKEK